MKEYFKKIVQAIEKKIVLASDVYEDKIVFKFLLTLPKKEIKYFEAGSGLGRFLEALVGKSKNFNITAGEINPELVALTKQKGFNTLECNLLNLPFEDNEFEIVHCSHVIEHFKYPEITQVLDEMLRVLKMDGFLIIHSPLMHPDFFIDIDHVRPYPPESLLNYYNNLQQQKVGKFKIKEISRWYRRSNINLKLSNKFVNKIINMLLGLFWIYFKFPFTKRNGYILILQKIN